MTNHIDPMRRPPFAGIADLTDDHVAEILTRLPPRQFAQAQAVCPRFRRVSTERVYPEQHAELLRQMVASARSVQSLAHVLSKPHALTYSSSTQFIAVHGKGVLPAPFDRSGLPANYRPRFVGPRYVVAAPAALHPELGVSDALVQTMCILRNLACHGVSQAVESQAAFVGLLHEIDQTRVVYSPGHTPDAGDEHQLTASWRANTRQSLQAVYCAQRCNRLPYPLRELVAIVWTLVARHEALEPVETIAVRSAMRVDMLQALSNVGTMALAVEGVQALVACFVVEVLRGHRVIRGINTVDPAVFRPDDPVGG